MRIPGTPGKQITGHCLCGAVSYTAPAGGLVPLSTSLCNCEDCQRSSGSAFSTVVPVRTAALTISGELKTFNTQGTDSHENRDRSFCPQCGSPILSVLAEAPEISWLKGGTLDDSSWLLPVMEVWTASAQPWTTRLPKRVHLRRGPPKAMLRSTRPLMRAWNALASR